MKKIPKIRIDGRDKTDEELRKELEDALKSAMPQGHDGIPDMIDEIMERKKRIIAEIEEDEWNPPTLMDRFRGWREWWGWQVWCHPVILTVIGLGIVILNSYAPFIFADNILHAFLVFTGIGYHHYHNKCKMIEKWFGEGL